MSVGGADAGNICILESNSAFSTMYARITKGTSGMSRGIDARGIARVNAEPRNVLL